MIKQIILIVFLIIYGANSACAINVLQENATLRTQLNSLSNKQQKENQKNILYYKGRSSYSGIDKRPYFSSSKNSNFEQKNIYEKKGVKFKLDTQKQEEKLKEIQEQEKTNTQTITPVENKSTVETTKTDSKIKSEQSKLKHNEDAE